MPFGKLDIQTSEVHEQDKDEGIKMMKTCVGGKKGEVEHTTPLPTTMTSNNVHKIKWETHPEPLANHQPT